MPPMPSFGVRVPVPATVTMTGGAKLPMSTALLCGIGLIMTVRRKRKA